MSELYRLVLHDVHRKVIAANGTLVNVSNGHGDACFELSLPVDNSQGCITFSNLHREMISKGAFLRLGEESCVCFKVEAILMNSDSDLQPCEIHTFG